MSGEVAKPRRPDRKSRPKQKPPDAPPAPQTREGTPTPPKQVFQSLNPEGPSTAGDEPAFAFTSPPAAVSGDRGSEVRERLRDGRRRHRPQPERPEEGLQSEQWQRPSRRRAKARKLSPALVWGLVGGAVLLVAGVVLAVVLSSSKPPAKAPAPPSGTKDATGKGSSPPPPGASGKAKELIVGKWESADGGKETLEFKADGSLLMPSVGIDLKGTYRLLNDHEMEITQELDGKKETERKKYTVTNEELNTTDSAGKPYKFKRVKSGSGQTAPVIGKPAGKATGKR